MKTNIARTLALSSHLSNGRYRLAKQCCGIRSQEDVEGLAVNNNLSMAQLYAFLDRCGDILEHDPRVIASQKEEKLPLRKVR